MKITYGKHKMPAKICKIKKFEYLQKLIYTEIMLKICNNIYTSSSIQSSKINTTNQLFKMNFNCS